MNELRQLLKSNNIKLNGYYKLKTYKKYSSHAFFWYTIFIYYFEEVDKKQHFEEIVDLLFSKHDYGFTTNYPFEIEILDVDIKKDEFSPMLFGLMMILSELPMYEFNTKLALKYSKNLIQYLYANPNEHSLLFYLFNILKEDIDWRNLFDIIFKTQEPISYEMIEFVVRNLDLLFVSADQNFKNKASGENFMDLIYSGLYEVSLNFIQSIFSDETSITTEDNYIKILLCDIYRIDKNELAEFLGLHSNYIAALPYLLLKERLHSFNNDELNMLLSLYE